MPRPAYSVDEQKPSLASDQLRGLEFGYDFIEKFIQVPFMVPSPTEDQIRALLFPEVDEDGGLRPVSTVVQQPSGTSHRTERIEGAEPETGTLVGDAGSVGRVSGAHLKAPDAGATAAEREKQRKLRTIRLSYDRDSERIRRICCKVAAPALGHNPRRLKQFLSLLRLRFYIAVETGLFDVEVGKETETRLTLEQLGKFIALSLRWPLLVADIQRDHGLLNKLQAATLDTAGRIELTPLISRWLAHPGMRKLLLFGCVKRDAAGVYQSDDQQNYILEDDVVLRRHTLADVNVESLLTVSKPPPPEQLIEYGREALDKWRTSEDGTEIPSESDLIIDVPPDTLVESSAEKPDRDPGQAEATRLNQEGKALEAKGDLERAEAMYRRALEIAEKLDQPETVAAEYGNLGNVLQTRGDLDGAEAMYRKAMEIFEKLGRLEGMAAGYGNLGNILQKRGDLDGAEAMYRKALEIFQKHGPLEGKAVSYGNLGAVLQARGNLEQAEEVYREALKIDEKLGRLEGMAADYGNLGTVYQARGDLDGAEAMYRKSLEINEKLGRLEGMAIQYGNLGGIYQTRGDLDQAEAMYRKALEIDEKLGRLGGMAANYGNLGVIYQTRGDLVGAREHWTKARDLFKQVGMVPELEKAQGMLDGLEDLKGDQRAKKRRRAEG